MENFKKDGKTSHRKHFTVRRPAQESSPERIYSTDRSFDDASPAYGERGHRSGERRPYGERRGYGEHRNAPDGERRGYGERRSYGSAEGRGRSSYGGGERRGYGEQRDGERRPYGEKKAWGKPAGRPGPKSLYKILPISLYRLKDFLYFIMRRTICQEMNRRFTALM